MLVRVLYEGTINTEGYNEVYREFRPFTMLDFASIVGNPWQHAPYFAPLSEK
jgi:hypothetical protein